MGRIVQPGVGEYRGQRDKVCPLVDPEPGLIATVYGAGLTKDAEGRLTLAFPYTMPQEAAQAAKDGLAELTGYIRERLKELSATTERSGLSP